METSRPSLVTAVRREGERVTTLELFFDLVFVLALTQCTALMAADPTWHGLVRGLLVLAVLWWAWVGYAWLTSVVDPEEGAVRLAIFVAMAAFLVAALERPDAFGDDALAFACAYAVVRVAHIWLFVIASRDDPGLRRSVDGARRQHGARRRSPRRCVGDRRSAPGQRCGCSPSSSTSGRRLPLRGGMAARCRAISPSGTG